MSRSRCSQLHSQAGVPFRMRRIWHRWDPTSVNLRSERPAVVRVDIVPPYGIKWDPAAVTLRSMRPSCGLW